MFVRATSDNVLPVSITRLIVPVGAETSIAVVTCMCPLGATWAGCMVDSDGAHPAAQPATTMRRPISGVRDRFKLDHGTTPHAIAAVTCLTKRSKGRSRSRDALERREQVLVLLGIADADADLRAQLGSPPPANQQPFVLERA